MLLQHKIGAFSRLSGVPVVTLKRWDNVGKLVALRAPSGYRYYTDAQVDLARGLKRKPGKEGRVSH